MSDQSKPIPRYILFAAGLLVVFTLAAATTARMTGVGAVKEPQAAERVSIALRFEDRTDGAIVVRRAADGGIVDLLTPGMGGFVRTVMRSLVRERYLKAQDSQTPFQLIRWADGRLSIDDPTTGRRIDLRAFGAANVQSFSRMMPAEGDIQ